VLIVATLVALLAQVKVSPLMVLPLLSFATAVNWSVAFTAIDEEAAVTVTVATVGGGGEVEEDPPPPQLGRRPQVTINKPVIKAKRASRLWDALSGERLEVMPASTIPGIPI
jgi:hypothetical protein